MIITVTGNPGSGKSTVVQLLKNTLKYETFYVGMFFKSVAKERSLTVPELCQSSDANELQGIIIDKFRAISTMANAIVDSRTAWIFIPGSFKIYLQASYPISAERLINDGNRPEYANLNKSSVIEKLSAEHNSEVAYFSDRFNVKYDSPENFDLFLSSDCLTPKQVHDQILKIFSAS